jgi:ABC-2 type transport system permease protein
MGKGRVAKMNIKFIASLTYSYGITAIARGPSYLIAELALPLSLLFMVGILSQGSLVVYAIIGGFIALIASNSLSSAGDAAFWRIQLRMQDLFVTTKITRIDYMMALTLSYFFGSLPGIALYFVIGMAYHIFTLMSLLVLVCLMALVTIATSSIAFIVAGMVKHVRNIWGIASILSIAMTLLPPTFYPYTSLPNYALYVLSISPVTPAAILAQSAFGLIKPLNYALIYEMAALLLLETIVFFALAKHFTVWREK